MFDVLKEADTYAALSKKSTPFKLRKNDFRFAGTGNGTAPPGIADQVMELTGYKDESNRGKRGGNQAGKH